MPNKWKGRTGKVYAKRRAYIDLNEVKQSIGQEHYIEEDASNTHSGIERYWVFEVEKGFALAFLYLDEKEELYIGSNQEEDLHMEILEQFVSFPSEKTEGLIWD
ncbi:hypothetical protein [Marinicella sp. W31]|uniref:hypothetical protein n=1 Tax=Marinicella sp. W31 TaxID=3023713 RepID=UPI003756A8A5